jgi:hypothetical protein
MLHDRPAAHECAGSSAARSRRNVADLEPEIRRLAAEFLDGLVDRNDGDLIADYAARLPMDVIARMLGVPGADGEQLRDWTNVLLDREEGVPDVTPAGVAAATNLYKYFCDFVSERRAPVATERVPRPHAVPRRDRGGEGLRDDQVVGFLFLLIIAGNDDHEAARQLPARAVPPAGTPRSPPTARIPGSRGDPPLRRLDAVRRRARRRSRPSCTGK